MKQNQYQGKRDSDIILLYISSRPSLLKIIITIWSYIKSSKKFYLQSERHFINHTLRNILYTDINGICPKFNEYDKKLILSSSQSMRFTIPIVKMKKKLVKRTI
jgi:hypothetical protein